MGRKYSSYLVVHRASEKGGTLYTQQYGPIESDADWHDHLLRIPKHHRPMRQNVYHNGEVPNPVPLHWCDMCDCWTLSSRHEHSRDRVPQVGDVWVEDHTFRYIPAGILPPEEPIPDDKDPRWAVRKRSKRFTVLKVEEDPGYEPFEYNGRQYEGQDPCTKVIYRCEYIGDWDEDEYPTWGTPEEKHPVYENDVRLQEWRGYIKGFSPEAP